MQEQDQAYDICGRQDGELYLTQNFLQQLIIYRITNWRMQSNEAELISQIKIYKNKVVIEDYQLQNFVKYIDQYVFKKLFFFCTPHKVSLAPSFQRAFSTLTQIQKADYYLSSLKIIHELNKIKEFFEEKKQQSEKFQVQYRKQNQNKLWKKTNIILHYESIMLQVQALSTKCKLCNYIIRKSKSKNKNAVVLQSTRAQCQPTTLRISHNNQAQLKSLISKLKTLMKMGLRKKIASMMSISRKSKQLTDEWQFKRQCMSVKIVSNIPLQHKSIRQILRNKSIAEGYYSPEKKSKQKIPGVLVNQDTIKQIDSFDNYQELQSGFFIHKTRQIVKKINYYNSITITLAEFDAILFDCQTFKQWKRSLYSISLIGDVPNEQTKFYHQINIYKDLNEVDYVYMRHRFQRDDMIYYIDKSVSTTEYGSHQNTNSRGKIEYILWRLRKKSTEVIQLIVQAEIDHLPCEDKYKAMSEQIGQLEKIPLVKKSYSKIKKGIPDVSFFSVDEGNISVSLDLLNELDSYQGGDIQKQKYSSDYEQMNMTDSFYTIQNQQKQIKNQEFWTFNAKNSPESQKQVKKRYFYQLQPDQKNKVNQLKAFKQDCFFDADQCVVNEIGDLVFTNQQKIKAQGEVIKTVLKRMGANLFAGKSILNVSLPVQIFATDTNIQRLCRSMAYGPHFLENIEQEPALEKMKAAICFAVGNLLLYIQMAKPFNPILGETYQGFIDGCPVYGQQISHHPPISSLYMVGRGYKVSANIEAKVELGLNSANGLNDGCYHITFNSKNSSQKSGVFFTSPPGKLSGVVYGDRKLNITNKNRFLDVKNRLFCELSWGKSKNGSNTVGRFHDYVEGKIVEMNRPVPNIHKIKESEKDLVLGYITGRWTQIIYFNGQPIFQVNKLQPYKVVEEPQQLLSDSRFREDRLLLQQYKHKDAQTAKERLEQIERLYRKLRKQYGA